MITWVNLTPHDVNYIHDDGRVETFPSQGVARAVQTTELIGVVDGLRITKSVFGEPVNLPDPQEGVFLIVSLATINAAKAYGRQADDLYIVNETVRDDAGRIVGCKSFGKVD